MTHRPLRLCLGCNGRDFQDAMVRFRLSEGQLDRDSGGRGGYLHQDPRCLDAFRKRKPFLRSLRASASAAERTRFVEELS